MLALKIESCLSGSRGMYTYAVCIVTISMS